MRQLPYASILMLAATLTFAAACDRRSDATIDQAAVDDGAFRKPVASEAGPPMSPITLPGGATVMATPETAEVQRYLASGEPAGRQFPLSFVSFVKGEEIREDPNGSFASLAAVLRAYPSTAVEVVVHHANPQQARPSGETATWANLVREALVNNGFPPERIAIAGAHGGASDAPGAFLTVTRK